MLLLLGSFELSQAQVLSDSINLVERKFAGYNLYQGRMPIGNNRVKHLMKSCPEGFRLYSGGKKMENIGLLLTAIGVATSGAAIGNYYLNGKTSNPNMVLIPAVIILGVGIPIYFSGEKKVKLSTAFYNQRCVKP